MNRKIVDVMFESPKSDYLHLLEFYVRNLLEQGWEPHGPIIQRAHPSGAIEYIQPMVQYEQ